MQHVLAIFALFILTWIPSINAKVIVNSPSNQALLVGQILAPAGNTIRNLSGLLLTIKVSKKDGTPLGSSEERLTADIFPLNYSIPLTIRDAELEGVKDLKITTTIWQPAYVFDDLVKLPTDNIDSLDLNIRGIRLLVVRGEILYDKNSSHHDLSNRQFRLVLMENKGTNAIVDQVTITCLSTAYPCPFEYCIDSIHAKPYGTYRLEAMSVNHELTDKILSRSDSKTNYPISFKTIPTFVTIIRDYQIYLTDSE